MHTISHKKRSAVTLLAFRGRGAVMFSSALRTVVVAVGFDWALMPFRGPYSSAFFLQTIVALSASVVTDIRQNSLLEVDTSGGLILVTGVVGLGC